MELSLERKNKEEERKDEQRELIGGWLNPERTYRRTDKLSGRVDGWTEVGVGGWREDEEENGQIRKKNQQNADILQIIHLPLFIAPVHRKVSIPLRKYILPYQSTS